MKRKKREKREKLLSPAEAAIEAMQVVLVVELLNKIGFKVDSKGSAEAAMQFGAMTLSTALKRPVTTEEFRVKLDRLMAIYRKNDESAALINRIYAGLEKRSRDALH